MTHTGNLLVKRNIYLGTRWTYDYLAYCCQSSQISVTVSYYTH